MNLAIQATVAATTGSQQRNLNHLSTLREQVLEQLLLGQLGLELLSRDIDFTVLHAICDRDGFDVVLDFGQRDRHIQLKTTILGSTTRAVPINLRLAAKPAGCVIWSVLDPATRDFAEFRWFGAAPGMPLPDPGHRAVRHSRANASGIKAVRSGMRSLPVSRFERLNTIAALADRLTGVVS